MFARICSAVIALTLVAIFEAVSYAAPTIQTLSDSHGQYYLVNNGALSGFQLYTSGSLAGKITAITYNAQQMVGSKGLYYDLQGGPNIYLGSDEAYSFRTGSNFVDISAFHPATATEPLDVTWHWILRDGESAFSTYLTYHHTTAMADWTSNENRVGAEFFSGSLFHYSSITDNYWGYQSAGDANRNQGRFITGETSDMRGIPSEYIKNYETKYDWRSTYAEANGVTGIVTAANTSAATKPLVATNYGIWTVNNARSLEGWNAGPTHPQTPVADGASMIPSPAASHFGGPSTVFTGNMDQTYGPILTYFNKATGAGNTVDALRSDANKYTTGPSSTDLNAFYDSLNLPYYASSAQRGTVAGKIRLADGTSMDGATVIVSSFDSTAYAADPLSQEYQRRAAGYNYWVTPNKDGTFSLPDVRPGNYRVSVIKPGNYREATWDNITVAAGGTTNTGNLTWQPDINGKGLWQVGTFDRTAGEFKHGNEYNNWVSTFDYKKDFPNGVSYTVNPANPLNDTQNWAANWGLNQTNPDQDFWSVNFNLASAPAANTTVTITLAVADQQFINDIAALVYKTGNTSYNRVDAGFDHTADNAPGTFRSGETSSRVLYRKLTFPGSWLHSGANKIALHVAGGNMQWDALRLDIQDPGTFSVAQWNGGSGNWTDAGQWSTQKYGYTSINKGTAGIANDTSTTFTDGATNTAPVNNTGSQLYYDAVINGGVVNLNSSVAVQKFSLLDGTLNVASGTPTLTANDNIVLGGGTFNGTGTIAALTTTTVNFANQISGGAKVNSTGAVTWLDSGSVAVTGSGSQWNTPGMTLGQGAANALTVSSGALVSTGTGVLTIGTQGNVASTGGTLNTAGISNAGTFASTGAVSVGTGSFTNTGIATINGGLSGNAVVNNGGSLTLTGTNTYTGGTTINGGVVQFGALTSIGGAGANVVVNAGGAVSFTPDITTAGFLARLNPSSTGAIALTGADAATRLDFTSGPLSALPNMAIGAVGNVTYTGSYTPSGNIYRLGGGGGTLNFNPLIGGTSSVVIGNAGSVGSVVLNAVNSYSGITTIKGVTLSVPSLADGGSNSPLGSSSNAAGNLVLDGGTLAATGATTTDRLFTVGPGGATLDGSGAMNWTNTGALSPAGSGNRTVTLIGSSSANIFSPAIADPAGGATKLVKNGSGTWTLNSAAHSYSGDTTILAGTLKLGVGATVPSGVGKGNVVLAQGATLQLAGNNLTINALNDGPAPPAGAGPNGNGGGALDNNSGTYNLTIGANNVGGQFSGVISGGINLVKSGSGTQILSGDNTYTGTTTITAGTLQIGVGGTPLSTGPGDGGLRGKLGSGNIINYGTLIFNRGYYTTATNPITGSGTLKQIANAQLVLGSANSYTGPTIIGGGIANIGLGGPSDATGLAYSGDCSLNASALSNGGVASSIGASTSAASNLILDGGTLFYSSTSAASTDRQFTVTQNGGAIYTSGGLTFSNASGAVVMSGTGDRTLSLGGDSTTTSTFNLDVGDPASGKTSLTKDRSATWAITSNAALTYSGDTIMRMGTLQLSAGAALPFGAGKGNLVFDTSTDFGTDFPAILQMNGNNLNVNGLTGGVSASTYSRVDNNAGGLKTFTVGNNNATATFDGTITGSINLAKTGSGTQIVTGANTYTGTTTISAGTLQFGNATASGAVGTGAIINNATLAFNRTDSYTLPNSISGTGSLNKSGSGTLILSSANTFSGDTKITAGTLQLGVSQALQGSTLDYNSYGGAIDFGTLSAATIGGLKGNQAIALTNATPANVTLSVGANGQSTTYSGSLSGGGSLTKIGSGTLTLTGTNLYTGPTTINAGTLLVNGTHSMLGAGAYAVNFGGRLGGTGTIGEPIAIANGGTLSPGASIGMLHATGGVTLNPGSILNLELQGTTSDYLDSAAANLSILSAGVIPKFTLLGNLTSTQFAFAKYGTLSGSLSNLADPQFELGSGVVNVPLPAGTISNDTAQKQLVLNLKPQSLRGNFNLDSAVNSADIVAMLAALTDLDAYSNIYAPQQPLTNGATLTSADLLALGDFNADGAFNNRDIQGILDYVSGLGVGSTSPVPEPATWQLVAIFLMVVWCTPNKQKRGQRFIEI